jgi:hypothetical protein
LEHRSTHDSTSYRTGEEATLTAIGILAAISSIFVLTMTLPGTTGVATAADNSTDQNVTLSVEEQTIVSVEPAAYNFSDMTLGKTNFSETTEALKLEIINDGSSNITQVYAHPDTFNSEDDNPLGTGKAREFAAGRFLWIKNASSGWYHAGTLLWNQTAEAGGQPSGIENGDNNNVSYGFYRNATADYLWELSANNSDGGGTDSRTGDWRRCNNSTRDAPELRIKTSADEGTNRDLGDGNTVTYTLDQDRDGNWSSRQVTSGPLQDHYVAAYKDCSRIYAYRFDNSPDFPASTSNPDNAYLINSNTELAPGEAYTARVGAAVPQGIPAGTTNLTTLTITANNAN